MSCSDNSRDPFYDRGGRQCSGKEEVRQTTVGLGSLEGNDASMHNSTFLQGCQ